MSQEVYQRELAAASEHWATHFKALNRFWTSRAVEPEFWALAARICDRHDIPPEMLIPLVHNHLNDRAGDNHVTFHCNVMKAEGLMERAIGNARAFLEGQLLGMKSAAIISGLSSRPENSLINTTRSVAELTRAHFRVSLDTLFRRMSPSGDAADIPDAVKDPVIYRCCDMNPFLLCDQAAIPRYRHVGFCSMQAVLRYQPWTRGIWEGLVRGGESMTDIETMAGPAPDPNPIKGPNWTWPPDVHRLKEVNPFPPHPELFEPRMFLHRGQFNNQVYLTLDAMAELVGRERSERV